MSIGRTNTVELKNQFLTYVELQSAAEESRLIYGADSSTTKEAYRKANVAKRRILKLIEVYENAST